MKTLCSDQIQHETSVKQSNKCRILMISTVKFGKQFWLVSATTNSADRWNVTSDGWLHRLIYHTTCFPSQGSFQQDKGGLKTNMWQWLKTAEYSARSNVPKSFRVKTINKLMVFVLNYMDERKKMGEKRGFWAAGVWFISGHQRVETNPRVETLEKPTKK